MRFSTGTFTQECPGPSANTTPNDDGRALYQPVER